jgi:hypothetical protein
MSVFLAEEAKKKVGKRSDQCARAEFTGGCEEIFSNKITSKQ